MRRSGTGICHYASWNKPATTETNIKINQDSHRFQAFHFRPLVQAAGIKSRWKTKLKSTTTKTRQTKLQRKSRRKRNFGAGYFQLFNWKRKSCLCNLAPNSSFSKTNQTDRKNLKVVIKRNTRSATNNRVEPLIAGRKALAKQHRSIIWYRT